MKSLSQSGVNVFSNQNIVNWTINNINEIETIDIEQNFQRTQMLCSSILACFDGKSIEPSLTHGKCVVPIL